MYTGLQHETHIILVFIHGFRGSHNTFKDFPEYLRTVLTNTLPSTVDIDTLVYPSYKTQGELRQAVLDFIEWLNCQLTMQPSQNTQIILLGHSMGGLLAVDAVAELLQNNPQTNKMNIQVGNRPGDNRLRVSWIIAFDTPFFGINQDAITDSQIFMPAARVTGTYSEVAPVALPLVAGGAALLSGLFSGKAKQQSNSNNRNKSDNRSSDNHGPVSSRPHQRQDDPYLLNSSTMPRDRDNTRNEPRIPSRSNTTIETNKSGNESGNMWKWGAIAAGTLAAGAAAAAAYTYRDTLSESIESVLGQTSFASAVFKTDELERRINRAVSFPNKFNFHCYYNEIAQKAGPLSPGSRRTFIEPPPRRLSGYFTRLLVSGVDEVTAHKSMFSGKDNKCYYTMCSLVAGRIREIVTEGGKGGGAGSSEKFDNLD